MPNSAVKAVPTAAPEVSGVGSLTALAQQAVGLLIPGMMLPVLVLLAVLGSATVLQRSFLAVRGA